MEENKKHYYWVEMDTDTTSAVSSACETFANIVAGKLDILEEVALQAYKKRMGREAEDVVVEQIHNALKLIQFVGWDTTLGNPVNVHGYNQLVDTLSGVSEVLCYQLSDDNEKGYEGVRYPIQWNDKIPLPRIVRKTSSVYNRKKQLSLFPKK